MFSMSQTWLSLLGWWEEWPGDSLTQDLRNISLLEDVIQLKQMKQPLISVNLWIMMIKILYQALTLSCSTSGAGSRIQSTSMPLISIFWVSFRYVHSPNKKGLSLSACWCIFQFLPWSYKWSVWDSKVQQQADRVDDKAGLAVASSSPKSSYSNWQQPLQ